MDLYVANLTRQHHHFTFRSSSDSKLMQVPIPIGQQQRVLKDATEAEIDAVVKQHAPYGMALASEVSKRKEFVGLCYSVDRKINVDAIMHGLEHNTDVLIDRGREIRRGAAVQSNNLIEKALEETNRKNGIDVQLDELEVLINEADERGRESPDGLKEGIMVSKSADPEMKISDKPYRKRGGRRQ